MKPHLRFFHTLTLILAATLPFLLFFDPIRDIDLQAGVLIISGISGLAAIVLSPKRYLGTYPRPILVLLCSFLTWCVLSSLLNGSGALHFWGTTLQRMGSLELIAAAGIALVAGAVPSNKLLIGLLVTSSVVAFAGLPYSYLLLGTFSRPAGLFAQADISACFIATGAILALYFLLFQHKSSRLLLLLWIALLGMLLLTQTRTVLITVILLNFFMAWSFGVQRKYILLGSLCLAIAVLSCTAATSFSRLVSIGYAGESLSYRYELQRSALKQTFERPAFGYGPGGLSNALACKNLSAHDLQATCRDGYIFNSSHNIYLDRVLALGWPGGIAFTVLTIAALLRGRNIQKYERIWLYLFVLVAVYYMTNVTLPTLELLFWVFMIRCLAINVRLNRGGA